MELTVEYIPALIVAKDKEGNYVKISEANKDEIYYCPVCKKKDFVSDSATLVHSKRGASCK